MKKLGNLFFYLLLGYFLPLVGQPTLLAHWQMILLMLAATTMIFTQPSLDVAEARAQQATDRFSMLWISVLALPAIVAPILEWAYGRPQLPSANAWTVVGLCGMVSGLVLRTWAIRTLGRAFTSTVQVQQGQILITSGPYHLVRHPSYLGAYITFLGCAVFLQSWIGLLVAAASMGIAYLIRIPVEEHALAAHFGTAWQLYCRRTWRMLPGLW